MINKSYSSLGDGEAMRGLSTWNTKNISFTGLLFQAFDFVIGVAALPLRLFLRENLGERSIKFGTFLLSIGLHIYYFTIFDILLVLGGAAMLDDLTNEKMLLIGLFALINPYFIFLILVFRKGVKHFKQKIKAAKNNEVGYSYSRGVSKYFSNLKEGQAWGFDIDDRVVRIIVEPRSVFKVGMILFLGSLAIVLYMIFISESESSYVYVFFASLGCTGLVLSFDAICLFIDEFSLFMKRRDKVLDMLDGQEDMSKLMNEKVKIEEGRKLSQQKIADTSLSTVALEEDVVSISNDAGVTIDDEEMYEDTEEEPIEDVVSASNDDSGVTIDDEEIYEDTEEKAVEEVEDLSSKLRNKFLSDD